MKSLVIVPTYNEKENISELIDTVLSLPSDFEILIVDDGSPDGTQDIVKKKMEENPKVHMKTRSKKLGLGTAYILGFKYGLENNYDLLYEMDADFSHPVEKLEALRKACIEGADVAIGSRYIKGGELQNWDYKRILLSKGASLYVQLITFMPIKDPTAGFICYKRKVLESFDLNKVKFVGYAFQIELKYIAWKLGFKLVEIPILFKDREKGKSKMHAGIIKEAIQGVLKLRFRNINKYY